MSRIPRILLSVLLVTAAATPAHAAPPPALWDHPGYDAEDSYYNPAEAVVNASSVRKLVRKWSVKLRQSDDMSCTGPSAPLVAGGRVYATDHLGISAYSAATGAPVWRFSWEVPADSSTPRLAVSGGLLIATNGDCHSNSDPDGTVTALDAATGLARWRLDIDTPANSVVVDKGIVVISGGSPSDEDVVLAYRAADGRALWRKAGYFSAGVSADGVLLATRIGGSETIALAITNGATLWSRPRTWRAQAASPAGDRFYATDDNQSLIALNVRTGAVHWTAVRRAGEWLAVDGRRVYRSAGRAVEALNAATGRRQWVTQLAAEAAQPVRAGGLLYPGGVALHAANGTVAATGPAFRGDVVVTGGRLFQVNNNVLTAYAP